MRATRRNIGWPVQIDGSLKPPAPARHPPAAWIEAPEISLWPGPAPGVEAFRPVDPPANWPPVFVRNVSAPYLKVFRPEHPNGAAVLIIPGGAYLFVSIDNEGLQVAERLTDLGYTVFVLVYRLPAEGWTARADAPLQDAQRALRLIRAGANDSAIDPWRIAVLGFSAGGHLAASLATGFDEPLAPLLDDIDAMDARPCALGLGYPVITLEIGHAHTLSRRYLLGPEASDSMAERRSPERHVRADGPPSFVVHAADDQAVPVENSLLWLQACQKGCSQVEAHIFQEGGHAFGIGYAGTPSAGWLDLFDVWLRRHGRFSA